MIAVPEFILLTGKTTIAQHYAQFLVSIGILASASFVEKTGSHLADEGVYGLKDMLNHSTLRNGGVIFIDEAYQLTNGKT